MTREKPLYFLADEHCSQTAVDGAQQFVIVHKQAFTWVPGRMHALRQSICQRVLVA